MPATKTKGSASAGTLEPALIGPRKWRVENSWSDKPGDKGFFQMSGAWFDEFNYEVVVRRSCVPKKSLEALRRKPVELEPWDPMGSLA